MEIPLLKERMESQDKNIDKKITKEIDRRMKYDESSMSNDGNNQHSSGRTRQKRSFRLIPAVQKNKFNENTLKRGNFAHKEAFFHFFSKIYLQSNIFIKPKKYFVQLCELYSMKLVPS